MPEKRKPSRAPALEAEVNAWFNDTFHTHGPVLSDALFNQFLAAKGKLIERLTVLIEKEG